MAEGYTQKEIDLMMIPVHEKLDTIIEQVKATNGRVRCLERWRSFMMGGLAVLTVVIIPIIVAVLR